MKIDELDYHLPDELIAQEPIKPRDHSKMLVLERKTGRLTDKFFYQLPEYLRSDDVLVINDTQALFARVFFRKHSGGQVEGLFIRQLADDEWEMMIKGIAKLKIGTKLILLGSDVQFKFIERISEKTVRIRLSEPVDVVRFLDKFGHVPLPPYIHREDKQEDRVRYQTVFSRQPGAVAAPTAGLHFTDELMEKIKNIGVRFVNVTLHVGMGTFEPIQTEDVAKHKMHSEYYSVTPESADLINRARQAGGRVFAVGTTCVRVLESACDEQGIVRDTAGLTDIFIYPPYRFKALDCMITNFHLPRTTLLAMIFAFASRELTLKAYHHAIENRYRFYSYGDAMLIV